MFLDQSPASKWNTVTWGRQAIAFNMQIGQAFETHFQPCSVSVDVEKFHFDFSVVKFWLHPGGWVFSIPRFQRVAVADDRRHCSKSNVRAGVAWVVFAWDILGESLK